MNGCGHIIHCLKNVYYGLQNIEEKIKIMRDYLKQTEKCSFSTL